VSPVLSEETLITEIIPTTVKVEPTNPMGASSPPTPTPGRTTAPPPGWDPALLKQIESQFARFVGPVAKVLVRRAGRQTMDVDELYSRLAETLASPKEREAFMATRSVLPVTRHSDTQPSARKDSAALTPEAINAAQHKLATYLGPIAKVIVKRAAAQAGSSRQFYLILADSLGSESERTRFLREIGAI
jgi:hypothetical protein